MAPSKAAGLLSALAETNTYLSLGLEIAGVVVPIGKALIQDIKEIVTLKATMAYQVLIQMDETDLQSVVTLDVAELAAINAELTRLGKPLVLVPAAPPAPEPSPAPPALNNPPAPTSGS